MEKKTTNQPFLDNHSEKDVPQKHKDLLGYDLPQDYFAKSKQNILNTLNIETMPGIKDSSRAVRWRSFYTYPIAASILILIGFGIWMGTRNQSSGTEQLQMVNTSVLPSSEQDILIESLLVEEDQVADYFDANIMENMLAENNLDIEIDNLLINSLFINDSLSDDYIDENLIEFMIL